MEHKMSDPKSKIPDLKEIVELTGKLFKDIKTSFSELVSAYKEKHPDAPLPEKTQEAAPVVKAEEKPEAKEEKKKAVKASKPLKTEEKGEE
jgi:hypothetical protein